MLRFGEKLDFVSQVALRKETSRTFNESLKSHFNNLGELTSYNTIISLNFGTCITRVAAFPY